MDVQAEWARRATVLERRLCGQRPVVLIGGRGTAASMLTTFERLLSLSQPLSPA
jgi:hypothetical protein